MNTIILKDIVSGTGTNSEAFTLYTILNSYITKGEKVNLSFEGASVMSSSFFNSSIGELIEVHGKDTFKNYITITMIKKAQADVLLHYINNIQECSRK